MIDVTLRAAFPVFLFHCIDLQELHCDLSRPSDLALNQYFKCCDSCEERILKGKVV